MSPYLIRPMKEQDIEAIIAIDAAVTSTGGPERAGFWRGLLTIHALPESAPSQPPLCEVAVAPGPGGRLAGFIIGDVQSWQFGIPRHGRIVAIGVHPEHRRHGVASLLANRMLETFGKMGLPFVHCLTQPGNTLGEFFRSVGFVASRFEVLEKRLDG